MIRLSLLFFGLMAGFFFAYSVTVMPGLDDTDGAAAVRAMQGINRVVRNPVFFAIFFGAAALPLIASIVCFLRGQKAPALIMAASGAVYATGVVVLTANIHVPMNDALALVSSPASADIWVDYSKDWTFWNHVRGAICVVCLGLSAEALRAG